MQRNYLISCGTHDHLASTLSNNPQLTQRFLIHAFNLPVTKRLSPPCFFQTVSDSISATYRGELHARYFLQAHDQVTVEVIVAFE